MTVGLGVTNKEANMFRLRPLTACCFASSLLLGSSVVAGPTYNTQVFATGSAVGGTMPDSVAFGDGSLWVAYQNGSDSTGASGSSTVVRYSLSGGSSGAPISTWTIRGNVDGLKVDPGTGLVWALQNNDANSALTVINPTTKGTTSYSFGSSYTNVANRGFDDVVFSQGNVYLSETNPASGSDAVVLKLTTGLNSPLQVSPILTSTFSGKNLATGLMGSTTITDSDSLKLLADGTLALTGEADQQIAFVHNPGKSNQYETFVSLLAATGQPFSGKADDTIYPNATGGTFYVADTNANTVYRITASGLAPGSVYIDAGTVFGILDTTSGDVTPIFTGVAPHGADFVPAGAAVPEPGTSGLAVAALLVFGASRFLGRPVTRRS